jgi:hypothetical protein
VNLLELLMNLDETNEKDLIMAQKINGRFIPESEADTCGMTDLIIGIDFFGTTDGTYEYFCDCVDDLYNQADVKAWAVELIEEVNNSDGSWHI